MIEGLSWGRKKLVNTIINETFDLESPEKGTFSYMELLFVIQELLIEEGKKYHDKGITKRGYFIFREFVKYLLYRNIANYDSMVLITSVKGSGKSSAAIMMAKEWCRLIGIKFNPKRHIAYTNADLMHKIDTLEKFEPIIADEAVRFANAADWAKKENKEVRKKLAQVRTKHHLFILAYPLKIQRIETNYLNSFVNYWIHLSARGQGAAFVPNMNPTAEPWGIKAFMKLGSYTEFTNTEKINSILKKHPNFWTAIKFPKPPKWLYDKYLLVREKNVYDEDSVLSGVSNQDMIQALLILTLRDIVTNDSTLTMNRVLLHIKNKYDINLKKQILFDAVEDSKHLVLKMQEKAIGLTPDKDEIVVKEKQLMEDE